MRFKLLFLLLLSLLLLSCASYSTGDCLEDFAVSACLFDNRSLESFNDDFVGGFRYFSCVDDLGVVDVVPRRFSVYQVDFCENETYLKSKEP